MVIPSLPALEEFKYIQVFEATLQFLWFWCSTEPSAWQKPRISVSHVGAVRFIMRLFGAQLQPCQAPALLNVSQRLHLFFRIKWFCIRNRSQRGWHGRDLIAISSSPGNARWLMACLAKGSTLGVRNVFGSKEGKGSNAHFHIIIQQEKGLEYHSCFPLGACTCMWSVAWLGVERLHFGPLQSTRKELSSSSHIFLGNQTCKAQFGFCLTRAKIKDAK